MNNWYLNRLRSISIAEIPYRVKQFIQKQYEKFFRTGKSIKEVQVKTLHPDFNFDLSNHLVFEYTGGNITNVKNEPRHISVPIDFSGSRSMLHEWDRHWVSLGLSRA